MGIDDLAAAGLGGVFDKAKARRKGAISQIALDGQLEAVRRKQALLDEDRESISDPSSPHYRPPQQGERPSPRAQWDDARACWVEWDGTAGEWVEIPVDG